MRYIKKFETKRIEYHIGDFVILKNSNKYTDKKGFIVGDMYQVSAISSDDKDIRLDKIPYDSFDVWVSKRSIRKVKDYELDANKYNL